MSTFTREQEQAIALANARKRKAEAEGIEPQEITQPIEAEKRTELSDIQMDLSVSPEVTQEVATTAGFPTTSGMAVSPISAPTVKIPNYEEVKEQLLEPQNLPSTLGVSKDEINLDEGVGGFERFGLSFSGDTGDIRQLKKQYEDVRLVDIGGRLRPMVRDSIKTKNKFIFVDELGFNPKDFVDLVGPSLEFAPEVALSVYATGPRTALFGYKTLAEFGPLTRGALGAATGRAGGSLARDLGAVGFSESDKSLNQAIFESIKEGGEAAAWEFLVGAPIAKISTIQLKARSKNDAHRTIQQSILDLERQYGIELPRTPGLISETPKKLGDRDRGEIGNITALDEGLLSFLSNRAAKARDTLFDLSARIQGKPKGTYADQYAKWASGTKAEYDQIIASIAERDTLLANNIQKIVDERIKNLASGELLDIDDLGSILQGVGELGTRGILDESNTFFRGFYNLAESRGVKPNPIEINNRFNSILNNLNLPKDLNDKVIDVFKPTGLKRLESQVKSLTKKTEPSPILDQYGQIIPPKESLEKAVSEFTYEQLDDMRKGIYTLYKNTLKTDAPNAKSIKKIYDEFDKILDDLAKEGGDDVIAARNQAKDFFKENVLTTKNKSIETLLKRNPDGTYANSGTKIVGMFYKGPNAVNNIRDLKKVIKDDPEALLKLKDGYISYLVNTAVRTDGSLDVGKLRNLSFDKSIAKELLGTQGAKKIEQLSDLLKFQSKQSIDIDLFNKLMDSSPQDVKNVLKQIQANNFSKIARDNFIKNDLLQKIAKGEKLDLTTPQEFIGAIKLLSGAEAKQVIEKMPKEFRDSFRSEFIADIYQQAGREKFAKDGVQKLSDARGYNAIWDVDVMSDKLSDKIWRERAEAVVGKNTIAQIESINNAMRGYQRKMLSKSDAELQARQTQGGTRFFTNNILSPVLNRLFAAAHMSETFAKVFSKTKDVEKGFGLILSTLLTSKEGMKALYTEMEKDVRLRDWVMKHAPEVLK
jgi:hypothetical protein